MRSENRTTLLLHKSIKEEVCCSYFGIVVLRKTLYLNCYICPSLYLHIGQGHIYQCIQDVAVCSAMWPFRIKRPPVWLIFMLSAFQISCNYTHSMSSRHQYWFSWVRLCPNVWHGYHGTFLWLQCSTGKHCFLTLWLWFWFLLRCRPPPIWPIPTHQCSPCHQFLSSAASTVIQAWLWIWPPMVTKVREPPALPTIHWGKTAEKKFSLLCEDIKWLSVHEI